jgi:Icc-related predicted phosphoesterase
MRIAAIADLHCRVNNREEIARILEGARGEADVLVLAGDLTDNGLVEEAEALLEIVRGLEMPVIGILGNHDHEGGKADEICQTLIQGGVNMLDGTNCEVNGVGFVGTKGFCGGFGTCVVQPFGEDALKAFVRIGMEEAINLENAVAKLNTEHKVAVLHYAPIADTLVGEPEQLFPFLGSERLANALGRQRVDVIVHGHAHHGSPSGITRDGIPVYNVSRFVQMSHFQRSYCTIEL